MTKDNDLVSLGVFTEAVKARIQTPAIADIYQKFEEYGLEKVSWGIVGNIPQDERRPLLYTLATHVTKEKPIFIYAIGKHLNPAKSHFVAASVDLLWALSLMMDDVVDNDVQRADKDTAWIVYGREHIESSLRVILNTLVQAQAKEISPRAATFLQECVDDGMKSLFAPQIHSLDSTEEDILRNVDQRARFHCEYPMRAIFECGSKRSEQQSRLGADALFACNRAGQILNDVKDLTPSNLYGRSLFRDIAGGTITIPLKMMISTIKGEDEKFLKAVFGKGNLDPRTLSDLEDLILTNLPRHRIHQKVSSVYERFIDIMRLVTDSDDFDICEQWVQYKLSQADKLLLG